MPVSSGQGAKRYAARTCFFFDITENVEQRRFHRMLRELGLPGLRLIETLIANIENLIEKHVNVALRLHSRRRHDGELICKIIHFP